jgi:hypothetical protein
MSQDPIKQDKVGGQFGQFIFLGVVFTGRRSDEQPKGDARHGPYQSYSQVYCAPGIRVQMMLGQEAAKKYAE